LRIGGKNTANCDVFIPHPTIYFGELAWDVASGVSYLDEFVIEITHALARGGEGTEKTRVLSHEIAHLAHLSEVGESTKKLHPLELLHYFRLLETIVLFWGSGYSKETASELEDILQSTKHKSHASDGKRSVEFDFYARHETPAVPIISGFRDSSRDLPCNLYAYACVPSSSLVKLNEVLTKLKMTNGVVELGAGTGYIARLLTDNGLQVTALDVAPTGSDPQLGCRKTDTTNEYHGNTPSFMPVQQSNASGLRTFFSSEKVSRRTALLLCYPPPLSNMAFDALQAYTASGGRCLIHIGEFQGLTGSHHFEDALMQNFKCIERLPCLHWGTDAADITIWVKKTRMGPECTNHKETYDHDDSMSSSLLLPCSNCLKEPAVRRCRLARGLVYCGLRCFNLHSSSRRIHLALNMIFLDSDLNFGDNNHFAPLDSFGGASPLICHNNCGATKGRRRKRKHK